MNNSNYKGACYECGRKYGEEYGFPDLIIEDWAWEIINPTIPKVKGAGLLCPSCICKKLSENNINCSGQFVSGPLNKDSNSSLIKELNESMRKFDSQVEGVIDIIPFRYMNKIECYNPNIHNIFSKIIFISEAIFNKMVADNNIDVKFIGIFIEITDYEVLTSHDEYNRVLTINTSLNEYNKLLGINKNTNKHTNVSMNIDQKYNVELNDTVFIVIASNKDSKNFVAISDNYDEKKYKDLI